MNIKNTLFIMIGVALQCATGCDYTGGKKPTEKEPVLKANISHANPGSFGAALLKHPLIHAAPSQGPNGTDAIYVDYVGYHRGSKRVIVCHPLDRPLLEGTLCFFVKFAEDFQFVKGGKMHGVGPQHPITGGNTMHPSGWSARLMFRENNALQTYLYVQDKKSKWGIGSYAEDFKFQRGRWYAVSIHVKVNSTADSHDGFTHVYVDGKRVIEDNNLQFRAAEGPDTEINQVLFSTFHGGHSPENAPVDEKGQPTTVHAWFSGLAFYEGLYILGE